MSENEANKNDQLSARIENSLAERNMPTRRFVDKLHVDHGLNRATIYRILAGETLDPRTLTIVSMCTVLKEDPDILLGIKDAKPPASSIDSQIASAQKAILNFTDPEKQLIIDFLRTFVNERTSQKPGPKTRLNPRTI